MKSALGPILIILLATVTGAQAGPRDLLDAVGIPPTADQRGQMDTVGFVTSADQMDSVLAQCRARTEALAASGEPGDPAADGPALSAAVCPHDDYYYAGRLYDLLMPRIKARTVVLVGVFHKARVFDCRDKLVFDSFGTWRGPYGPVAVSPLREDLISRLPAEDVTVDNDMHMIEHSLEAIVPWLQAFRPDVEIVPVLVPYMDWATSDRLAGDFASALTAAMRERGWSLGQDVAVVVSADAVHYGDAGWGGNDFAAFGTDPEGYARAVARDRGLASSKLAGPLRPAALRDFLYTCVDSTDVTKYRLTWCGRFSIPFGLNAANLVNQALNGRPLEGTFLDYGTSLGEVSLDLEAIPGLGVTAPNNLHHWVGYAAIGYR